MNIVKISFLVRSPSVGWDYKENTKRELADDLAERVTDSLAPNKPVHMRKGSVQHHFYLATEVEPEEYAKLARKILEALLPDEKFRKQVIVSVTEPNSEELEQLRAKQNVEENPTFWQVVAALPKTEKANTKEAKKEAPQQVDAPTTKTQEKVQPKTEEKEEAEEAKQEEQTEEVPSLSQQAKKLKDLKDGLLGKVRGQRHAVEEVVQTIFESEMFSSQNPDRKGPLATFLFTGPSGVGKTFLAELTGKLLGRPAKVVDMSEYSDNLSNGKFNGEYGQTAEVTGFVRKHPDGIIIFDEIEKAHINTIHLFLQILDAARLMDHQLKKEVSFRNNIVIMTTNAGKALYDDTTVCDLSATPRSVILEALRTDTNPQTKEPFFPECITTRMANGHVILFNHLEPYALMQIVRDEIAQQMQLFEKATGVRVEYDPVLLSAVVLYNGGGMADARTLKGLARSIVVRELQEIVMQLFDKNGSNVDTLNNVTISVDTQEDEAVSGLFTSRDRMQVAVFTQAGAGAFKDAKCSSDFFVTCEMGTFKRRIRGVTDYILLDPLCGYEKEERRPNDVEDLDSDGMMMFDYVREFAPEIPVYILDTLGDPRVFDTLLARGARGVISVTGQEAQNMNKALKDLSFSALINNAVYSLGRSGKFLTFNCAQYLIDDSCAVISVEKLKLKSAPRASDSKSIAKKGENNNLKFKDIIGCRAAKEALSEYKAMLDDPRKTALSGKRMPKGVLLYGPPGTGKTMLAKALANECNATFIPTSATSFFGSLVGQTEKNIQDLFRRARKYAPSIIFIDEVDAIGRMRTGSAGSVHNEDALNTFLAEMDGFVTDEKRPVFILAATNYSISGDSGRVLDPAFVRRFDSRILIPLPDTEDRYALLTASLKKHGIHFGENHEKILRNMAKRTGGMNNADIEMMNAQFVRTLGEQEPDGAKYMDALDAFRFGEVNKMDPAHLRQTACHEAGHALVCRLCGVTPSFLTVVSRGGYGGFMESAGEKTSGTYTYQELMDRVARSLAGRAAEIEVYGQEAGNNTGASSDIHNARYVMKIALNDYAMGEKLYARWTQEQIEQLMQQQYARTCKMIRDHRAVLEKLTDLLVERKSLDQTQLEAFFAEENI